MSSYLKLSLPKSISSTNNDNDTFSRDLLRQFDKKRSRLHFELGFASQEPSPESSRIMTPTNDENEISEYYNEEPVQLDEIQEDEFISRRTRHISTSQNSNISSKKSSSTASELFRKSSAFLKSKLTNNKRNSIDPPKKLIMKTTISIPSLTNTTRSFPVLTTPTITQYPPKPLVYSPIEPIPNSTEHKPLLHRISMPLLRVYNDTTTNLSRHTSFGRRRKSEPDNNTKKKLKRSKQQQQQQQQQQQTLQEEN